MSYISEKDKIKILATSENKLLEVISDFTALHKSGVNFVGECPCCKAERGLTISPAKGVFTCFKCKQIGGKKPVDYLLKGQDMDYPEALEYLAKKFNIFLEERVVSTKRIKKKTACSQSEKKSFCSRMLADSGLTEKDVKAKIHLVNGQKGIGERSTFRAGTLDSKGGIANGDDVIIEYYDLEGYPVKYELKDKNKKPTGTYKEYYRARWQFPDEHKDKSGKPFKYKSPPGSSTFIYIPERLRSAYAKRERIQRLYIQEGEKKSEKACKHGLPSIAISGIQNLGTNGRLPEDLIKIIQGCQVQEVVFILDADWDELSSSLKVTEQADKRPRLFFSAVRNYKEYMRTLKNRELYVEIYFGYVLKNDANDKGIDDLLANTLKGQEEALKDDIDYLINEKNLTGKYIQLHKITTWTDYKITEIWGLHNPKVFAERHKEVLKDLPEFIIGRHKWRFNEAGEFESAQPIESDEQYWEEVERADRQGNVRITYEFKYVRARRFLEHRGFGRYRTLAGDFQYIHLTPPVVRKVETWEVRDYIFDFTDANCKEEVNEMIAKGGVQYFGPDKLQQLGFVEPNFLQPIKERQLFYFEDVCWEITAERIAEIDYSNITHHIWGDQKKKILARLTPELIHVSKDEDKFSYAITELGQKCHFLLFLENTSNFIWRKEELMKSQQDITITAEDRYENTVHLIAKLCAIGYMITEYKDRSVSKAVVAMDGKQSEVGVSNGRSGKSLVGELMKNISSTVYINGKKPDLATDNFLWDEITEKTKMVFIDDVRPSFDFESLFANVTGDWAVNYKGGRRCTIPFSSSPKIYITTNHALKGEGGSFKDRQWLLAFSDWYNDTHKPTDDFGLRFFDDWDFEQWNLTWNLLAKCVQLYLQYGVVESPGERLDARILRQSMGEEFISWAEEYYSSSERLNNRIPRKDVYDDFLSVFPEQRKYCGATLFKKKILNYCKWKDYTFNPHRYDSVTGKPAFFDKDKNPDTNDKSGGVEYFTIGDENFNIGDSSDLNQSLFNEDTPTPY